MPLRILSKFLLAALTVLLLSASALAQGTSPKDCDIALDEAALTYVRGEFRTLGQMGMSGHPRNDRMCFGEEIMANMVITVFDLETKQAWWGIFHIHAHADGRFVSAVSIENTTWTPMRIFSEDWRPSWCAFLKTIYPDDFALQCKD